jgi:GNAT superfamily N-acetyltransferase
MSIASGCVQQIGRDEVQQWLPLLNEWLLGDSVYSVQHTWPQLYRNDGHGAFFTMTDGDRLISHCACRLEQLHDGNQVQSVGLLGSVATAPDMRGQGLASQVIQAAVQFMEGNAESILLWAERPDLYQRADFYPTGNDTCLLLARRPTKQVDNVRLLDIRDHAALHALHEQKPRYISRSIQTMSTLLSTPGMTTVVLERNQQAVAYACIGKGADLHGHIHEVGGTDEDLAELIPIAMHVVDQIELILLVPPYRQKLQEMLGHQTSAEFTVPGPMMRSAQEVPVSCWIDGLDSV